MIKCRLCNLDFDRITTSHLRLKHNGRDLYDYQIEFPDAPTTSKESAARQSKSARDYQSSLSLEAKAELNRKNSEGLVAVWASRTPEEKAYISRQQSESMIVYCASRTPEETKEISRKFSRTMANRSPEEKADASRQISENRKKHWSSLSPEEQTEQIRRWQGDRGKTPNKCELMLWEFLEEVYPGMFIPDWKDKLNIGGRYPDFRSRNGSKIIIESFGSYHHSPVSDRPSEEELVEVYGKEGWTCLVVWADSADDIIFEWPNISKWIRGTIGGKPKCK